MGDWGERIDDDRVPAAVRVRAAVLAAAAAPGGCPSVALQGRVCDLLGVTVSPPVNAAIQAALGVLIVTGAVDERDGRLVMALGVRTAV
ncbi:MAG TPA: hypothetical protein PKE32_03805 [Miltoncostaeaceae bacterium]|nr:hypothetical protein [Miltoncostaeaceae bacterium]